MGLLELIGTVALLGSILVVLILVGCAAVFALRSQWGRLRSTAKLAGIYIGCYAVALIAVALLMPRTTLGSNVRECFDDWCIAGISAAPASNTTALGCASKDGSQIWIATAQVSSTAKRIRQRAADATAVLEDQAGHEYSPCAAPLGTAGDPPRMLSDALGPGESFQVTLAFALPSNARPAGLVVSHGAFPGVLIIGADQSLLHPRTLLGVAVQ